jgi:hypothetical protein
MFFWQVALTLSNLDFMGHAAHNGKINDKFKAVETSPETVIYRCFRKTVKRYYEFRHVRLSIRPSAWNNLVPTIWIFMKFNIGVFFENLSRSLIKI